MTPEQAEAIAQRVAQVLREGGFDYVQSIETQDAPGTIGEFGVETEINGESVRFVVVVEAA
jgi:hypothetical protein